MKVLKIAMVMLIVIVTMGAVCAADSISDDAISDDTQETLKTVQGDVSDKVESTDNDIKGVSEGSLTDLYYDIGNATGSLDITHNYKFNNETDNTTGIHLREDNFIINGNGRTIDGDCQSRIFIVSANNITINNLTFINAYGDMGGSIFINTGCSLTLNDVVFENCSALGGAALAVCPNAALTTNNNVFKNNHGGTASAIFINGNYTSVNDKFINNGDGSTINANGNGLININGGFFTTDYELEWALLNINGYMFTIENTVFANASSKYATAIYIQDGRGKIKNSDFVNLTATMTAGAIGLKSLTYDVNIDGCNFINTKSQKNGGAFYADVMGMSGGGNGYIIVTDSQFINCSSEFGGAFVQLAGHLTIENSNFTSNKAVYCGGAIYTSCVPVNIYNSSFTSNAALTDGFANGGAAYFDNGNIALNLCTFENNFASEGSSIYAYDCGLSLTNNRFNNPTTEGVSVFTVFDKSYYNDGNFSNDTYSLNNTNYGLNVVASKTSFIIINNTIDVTIIPKRFDLREWGWVSSVKNQGNMGACWTFGTIGALESALLRYTNMTYDFSENNLQNTMLRFSKYGNPEAFEGGTPDLAIGYFVSWLGASPAEYDVYDELGKISQLITTVDDVQIINVVLVPVRKNSTDNDPIKKAILKYGSLAVNYFVSDDPLCYNDTTYAYYYNGTPNANHMISVVGWDDNFPKENFARTPDGDGAWICKNSWGEVYGDQGFFYISYYDTSFVAVGEAMGFVIENIDYDEVYQLETCFANYTNYTYYMNRFVAAEDALIGAVGTYFADENQNYEFSVFVNGVNVLNQNAAPDHRGYSTVRLDRYIPIKAGDVFEVIFKNNYFILGSARGHVEPDTSFASYDGENWIDLSANNTAAMLKVYILADNTKVIDNSNVSVYYGAGSYFAVKVVAGDGHAVGAGEEVKFTINGRKVTATTDDEGIAKVKITDVPGTYGVTTAYNGKNYKNKVTVKLNLNKCKIINNKNIVVDYLGGKYFSVKVVSADGKVAASGATVKFTINGRTVAAKTNKNGIAKVKITDAPKKYVLVSTFNGKSVKNAVTVRHVVKTTKVTVKKTAKAFTLKAVLKINGKAQKGKWVTFKFKGKTYKAKTNAKGIAQKAFNKNVIAKLAKGKTYIVQVSYLKDIVKSTVKVM